MRRRLRQVREIAEAAGGRLAPDRQAPLMERIEGYHRALLEQPLQDGFVTTYAGYWASQTDETSIEDDADVDLHVAAMLMRRFAARDCDHQIVALPYAQIARLIEEVTGRLVDRAGKERREGTRR